jgi:hypothetical protein
MKKNPKLQTESKAPLMESTDHLPTAPLQESKATDQKLVINDLPKAEFQVTSNETIAKTDKFTQVMIGGVALALGVYFWTKRNELPPKSKEVPIKREVPAKTLPKVVDTPIVVNKPKSKFTAK